MMKHQKKSRQKRSEQLSIVQSVGQQKSFGRKVCRSSGRSGSAENVVTVSIHLGRWESRLETSGRMEKKGHNHSFSYFSLIASDAQKVKR